MQFGIGILGNGWTSELALEMARTCTLPPAPNFAKHAHKYAAKLAADTILSEPPGVPDLGDEALVEHFAGCARFARPSEVGMVRDEFIRIYGHHLTRPVTTGGDDQ